MQIERASSTSRLQRWIQRMWRTPFEKSSQTYTELWVTVHSRMRTTHIPCQARAFPSLLLAAYNAKAVVAHRSCLQLWFFTPKDITYSDWLHLCNVHFDNKASFEPMIPVALQDMWAVLENPRLGMEKWSQWRSRSQAALYPNLLVSWLNARSAAGFL